MAHDLLFDSEESAALLTICTRRLIRNIGIGGILWGVINTGLGILFVQESMINLGLVGLGVLMRGVGVQALRRPTLADRFNAAGTEKLRTWLACEQTPSEA